MAKESAGSVIEVQTSFTEMQVEFLGSLVKRSVSRVLESQETWCRANSPLPDRTNDGAQWRSMVGQVPQANEQAWQGCTPLASIGTAETTPRKPLGARV